MYNLNPCFPLNMKDMPSFGILKFLPNVICMHRSICMLEITIIIFGFFACCIGLGVGPVYIECTLQQQKQQQISFCHYVCTKFGNFIISSLDALSIRVFFFSRHVFHCCFCCCILYMFSALIIKHTTFTM